MTHHRLLIDCPDKEGITAAVTNYISSKGGNITDASQHLDSETNWFFARHEIASSSLNVSVDEFEQEFAALAHQKQMRWSFHDVSQPKRLALLVGNQLHCLADVLYRWQNQDLHCHIPCIISNHADAQYLAKFYNIPFFKICMQDKTKAFAEIENIVHQHTCDTWVLARFMQIIPSSLTEKYQGKLINIHHSFLPSFVGGKPYHQAYERGVKLIGATCHYVTNELDAGPIIAQDVMRIDTRDHIEDYIRKGRDCERSVLARGLRAHLEDMIIIKDNKTIILE